MKKICLFTVLVIIIMTVISVSADYSSYIDVVTDAKKMIKDPAYETWERTDAR